VKDSVKNKPPLEVLMFESLYFEFESWPLIKLKADHELADYFEVGDTIVKESGSSEIYNDSEYDQKLSLFTPFRR
jgi:hypothetical protein